MMHIDGTIDTCLNLIIFLEVGDRVGDGHTETIYT